MSDPQMSDAEDEKSISNEPSDEPGQEGEDTPALGEQRPMYIEDSMYYGIEDFYEGEMPHVLPEDFYLHERGGLGEGEHEECVETEEETTVTDETEIKGETSEDLSSSLMSRRMTSPQVPLRDLPAYKSVIKYIKTILEDIVARNPDNAVNYFVEYSRRVLMGRKETYGVPTDVFLPTAFAYINTIVSFSNNFQDAIEEYVHVYGNEQVDEKKEEPQIELPNQESQYEIQGEMEVIQPPSYIPLVKDDDFDEGGYVHYEDQKLEPKEPEFDEFAYVPLEQFMFFDEVGIGLNKYEQYEIHMALPRLAKVRNLTNVKFWGKIFGIYQDYYIAEAEMSVEDMKQEDFDELPHYSESDFVGECEVPQEEECEEEESPPEAKEEHLTEEQEDVDFGEYYGEYGEESLHPTGSKKKLDFEFSLAHEESAVGEDYVEEAESDFELGVSDGKFKGKVNLKTYKLPPLPKTKVKSPREPPMEEPGEGVNKHVFFVCNDPKADWIRLPHVTPEQIVIARQIRKYFTGYLSAKVTSYPQFPGIEMNLLRAQIARISAGTQVSPAGYYRFDEGEEAADAFDVAAGKGGVVLLNREFDPLTVKDLTDPSCSFWVHHTSHILNQGRTVWYNVDQKRRRGFRGGEGDFEYFGEEAPPYEEAIGERGPPLLTSCAEDLFMEFIPPWTVRPAIELAPHEGSVFIRSNFWPGAYAFAFGRKTGTMYIGWGLKAVSYGYTPPGPPYLPHIEYPDGPEIMEVTDPTPEQEEDYMKKLEDWLKSKERKMPMVEGEGFEGEDEIGENEEEEVEV